MKNGLCTGNMANTYLLLLLIACCSATLDTFDNQVLDTVHFTKQEPFQPECGRVVYNYRFDCFPDSGANESACTSRGCCWDASPGVAYEKRSVGDIGVPYCYFPINYPSYNLVSYNQTHDFTYEATLRRDEPTWWPNESKEVKMETTYYGSPFTPGYPAEMDYSVANIMRVKIYDPTKKKYEVPLDHLPPLPKRVGPHNLTPTFTKAPFTLTVGTFGKAGIKNVFDTNMYGAPLIISDQFIQISARLPTTLLFGLGEHKDDFMFNASNGFQQRGFWARDAGPQFNTNLYGVHNFFMQTIRGSFPGSNITGSQTWGMFIANSNAQEMIFQPMPAMTYRTTGGVLDMFFMIGDTPQEVVQLYNLIIGKPFLPPYWSLGFHLCRYGYNSGKRVKEIVDRNRALKIPYDVQWTDIDYMSDHKDWTYDKNNFSDLPDLVNDLHNRGQKYIIIVDPGIYSLDSSYAPYTDGLKRKVFITNSTGQPEVGVVWPGNTVFPDFTNPNTSDWWYDHANTFHQALNFDGLWTDMNEPSNFVMGSKYGCTNSSLDNPPYVPDSLADRQLYAKTLCPSAMQHLAPHYDVHNMFGHYEMKASMNALLKIRNKRSLVISRSTFMGSGYHGGHWSGDISSTWEDLRYSIPDVLDFNLFGIPMVGADICGFAGDTTYELCIRWMQLGSFYPFMRNHNDLGSRDQDPGAFNSTATDIMKKALELRYTFLPYLYTLFYQSHMTGSAVATPLFFNCPEDDEALPIQEQFFWGDGLLVSPVLYEGATEVQSYFCGVNTSYYDLIDGKTMVNGKMWMNLSAPLDTIRLHQRQGTIIPIQEPAVTTELSRKNPFSLLVALPCPVCPLARVGRREVLQCVANGSLYWDDGDTLSETTYNYIKFNASQTSLKIRADHHGYESSMPLAHVAVFGVPFAATKATLSTMVSNEAKTVKVESEKISPECYKIVLSDFSLDLKTEAVFEWSK